MWIKQYFLTLFCISIVVLSQKNIQANVINEDDGSDEGDLGSLFDLTVDGDDDTDDDLDREDDTPFVMRRRRAADENSLQLCISANGQFTLVRGGVTADSSEALLRKRRDVSSDIDNEKRAKILIGGFKKRAKFLEGGFKRAKFLEGGFKKRAKFLEGGFKKRAKFLEGGFKKRAKFLEGGFRKRAKVLFDDAFVLEKSSPQNEVRASFVPLRGDTSQNLHLRLKGALLPVPITSATRRSAGGFGVSLLALNDGPYLRCIRVRSNSK